MCQSLPRGRYCLADLTVNPAAILPHPVANQVRDRYHVIQVFRDLCHYMVTLSVNAKTLVGVCVA